MWFFLFRVQNLSLQLQGLYLLKILPYKSLIFGAYKAVFNSYPRRFSWAQATKCSGSEKVAQIGPGRFLITLVRQKFIEQVLWFTDTRAGMPSLSDGLHVLCHLDIVLSLLLTMQFGEGPPKCVNCWNTFSPLFAIFFSLYSLPLLPCSPLRPPQFLGAAAGDCLDAAPL